jgi:hypothetical protein
MPRPHRAALAAAVLALAVSGCAGGDDKAAESAIEEAAEEAGEDLDVDIDGDEVTIEGSDGAMSVGGDLPDGFPVDDIPLVDGEVLIAVGAEGQGYQVTLDVGDTPGEAMVAARDLLVGAGFALDEELVTGSIHSAQLSSDAYAVYLTATEAGDRTSLLYSVEIR